MVFETYQEGFNVLLHILLLFTFLFTFYFSYIRKLTANAANGALESIICKNTNQTLDSLSKAIQADIPKAQGIVITKSAVHKLGNTLIKNSKKKIPEIEDNNNKVFHTGIAIISALFTIWFVGVMYVKLATSIDISIRHLIIENTTIFLFVGVIEYLFFTYIASKYVPTDPSTIGVRVLERVKYNINKDVEDIKNKGK